MQCDSTEEGHNSAPPNADQVTWPTLLVTMYFLNTSIIELQWGTGVRLTAKNQEEGREK